MVTKTNTKKVLKEFASDDGQSVAPEPVNVGNSHSNRSADRSGQETPVESPNSVSKAGLMAQAASLLASFQTQQLADFLGSIKDQAGLNRLADNKTDPGAAPVSPTGVKVGVTKEDIDLIFGEDELDEDLKERATTVFDATVGLHVQLAEAELQEQFETRLTEAVEEIRTELVENVDRYLDYVVEKWIADNEVALVSATKVDVAEDIVTKLKNLLGESFITVNEDTSLAIADLSEQVDEYKERLAESVRTEIELKEQLEQFRLDAILEEAQEGLAMTEQDKLVNLAENIKYIDAEDFASKLQTIKETYFGKTTRKVDSEELNEEFLGEDASDGLTTTNPAMAGYVTTGRKLSKPI